MVSCFSRVQSLKMCAFKENGIQYLCFKNIVVELYQALRVVFVKMKLWR